MKVLRVSLYNTSNSRCRNKHLEYEKLIRQTSSFRELKSVISLVASLHSQTPLSWRLKRQ